MIHKVVNACRICGSAELREILDLGEMALTGVFPRPDVEVESGPIELVKCDETKGGCGLVQLRHSYDPSQMYGNNYGYRSSLNQSMAAHLQRRVKAATAIGKPKAGDLILDIGSNDCTTLKAYPTGFDLVGMDPSGLKFLNYYPPHVHLIGDFFNAAAFEKAFPGRKAKIVTSFAMFYDLEAPLSFVTEVERILADDGIWVFEQSYLPTMLAVNAYDTICHEHVEYYALRQIKWMTDRAGLKIIDVELNDVNGGSFCITVAKAKSAHPEATRRVGELLAEEDRLGLSTMKPFEEFRDRVTHHREQLLDFVAQVKRRGQLLCGYGASTKGNVILQYAGLGTADVPVIAEVNEDKYGCVTPGTKIPIASERDVHAMRPDYLMVLPWHYRQGIVAREASYLARGGRLMFPLPAIEVAADDAATKRAA